MNKIKIIINSGDIDRLRCLFDRFGNRLAMKRKAGSEPGNLLVTAFSANSSDDGLLMADTPRFSS